MTWHVACKRCGEELKYSDRSFVDSLDHGFSRPEYCEDCQLKEGKSRKSMGSPYFHVPHIGGLIEIGLLGEVIHEEREHVEVVNEASIDETQFGLTKDKVKEIAEWLSDPSHRVVIVEGPTGSGKSTALPYWLVNPPEGVDLKFFTRDGKILVTQPRINAVKGISEFLGEILFGAFVGKGSIIGYSFSKEDKTDWRNAIELTTDGKMVNHAAKGKLSQFGIILVDEAHERSENIEQIMAVLKERLPLYPNLKLIIASATIDTNTFLEYFKDHGAKLFSFEGLARVDKAGNSVEYETVFATEEESLPYEDTALLRKKLLPEVTKKAKWLIKKIAEGNGEVGMGDVLIFLHTTKAIDKMVEDLRAWVKRDGLSKIVKVYPLYSKLDQDLQDKATKGVPPEGTFRVIVSTNVAEASITIDTLKYEIETGVMILTHYDNSVNKTEYPLGLIGKDNARQRWGRTGRTSNGIVYTMYSEQQFEDSEVFPEYQIPPMARANMESSILAAKEAGLVDVENAWLARVDPSEIERAVGSLTQSGAIDESGALTEYGFMLRRFSYSSKLVDILRVADDVGCLVEMATVLPVIKNDGDRRLLKTNFRWDVYTKRVAQKRHEALMAGCIDDIEFILKLYKAWDELPWLDGEQLRNLSSNTETREEMKDQLRRQWAKIHSVNHETLLAIREERQEIIDTFNISMKSDEVRSPEPILHGAVVKLLKSMLDQQNLRDAPTPFEFVERVEHKEDSIITCYLAEPIKLDSDALFSRLFVEQVYPIGFKFEAEVLDDRGRIKTFRNLTRSEELDEKFSLLEDDVELEDDEDEFEVVQDKFDIHIHNMNLRHSSVDCLQSLQDGTSNKGDKLQVEVVGYDLSHKKPIVLVAAISDPTPFAVFSQQHKVGDKVEVKIVDHFQLSGDFQVSLVAQDVATGFEILVEPADMSFTTDSSVTSQIPKETRILVNVENIDEDLERVRLSNWEAVEKVASEQIEGSQRHDSSAIATGTIVDIYTDGKLMILLDWGSIEHGVGIVTRVFPDRLPKPHTEYAVGEKVAMRVYRKGDPAHRREVKEFFSSLSELPTQAKSFVPDSGDEGLFYSNGRLRHKGRMTYEKLFEFRTMSGDKAFQDTLRHLYWLSNQVEFGEFTDMDELAKSTSSCPVGSSVHGVQILEIDDTGIIVQLGQNSRGYVHQRNVMGSARRNTFSILQEGMLVNVKVIAFNLKHQIPEAEIVGITNPDDDPLNHINVEFTHAAMITGIDDEKGIMFLRLDNGIEGSVHHRQMYFDTRLYSLDELYSVGTTINTKIHKIDMNTRLVDFHMLISDHDPLNALRIGEKYDGIVKGIESFGVFVEVLPGEQGLVHRSEMYLGRGADFTKVFQTGEEVVVLLKEIQADRKIKLSMLIPEYEHLDPTANLKVGAKRNGVVHGVQSYGYFITIADGVQGLLSVNDIPEQSTGFLGIGGKKKPVLSVGLQVEVVINNIKPNRKNPNKTDYELGLIRIK